MAELADAADSKSADLRVLGVRLPLPAPAQINEKQWSTCLNEGMALRRSKRSGFSIDVCVKKPRNPVVFGRGPDGPRPCENLRGRRDPACKACVARAQEIGGVIHGFGDVIERVRECFRVWPVAVAKARIVGRYQVIAIGKPGEQRLEHPR